MITQGLVLNIENLDVSFDIKDKTYFVLRGINLELYSGQKIAIVGESGSGKTTLANSVLLLNEKKITSYFGNIIFYPKKENCNFCFPKWEIVYTEEYYNEQTNVSTYEVFELDEYSMNHLRGNHISIIFQDPFTALNPVIPVGKQVEEVIKNHNPNLTKKDIYNKVLDLFLQVNLNEAQTIYKKYPHQLSGGQLQRVCISIAIANQPEIIIADEPTTALDAYLRETILDLLINMTQKYNSALLLITHDINIIKNYVDYVYILYAGEILEIASTEQIFYNPLHPYTQLLFSCYADKAKKGHKLPTLPYELPDISDHDFVFEKCIFLNRCNKKIKRCNEGKPELYSIKEQKVKCFLYER